MNSDKKEFVIPAKDSLLKNEHNITVPFESSGEFVLPDYMPKVQKVLRVEARVLPPSRFVGATAAEMSGSVLYTLIYVGDDGEVSATVLPSKYDFSVPFGDVESVPEVFADVSVDTLIYRLAGPRNINMRTRLSATAGMLCRENVSMQSDETEGVHKLYGEIDLAETSYLSSEEIIVSDTVDTGHADVKLLWCGSSAAVSDIRVTDGGVNVRGEINLKLLADDSGKTKMYSKKISFDEFVDGEISKGTSAVALAKVVSTEAAKDGSTDANVDITFTVEVIADAPGKLNTVSDVFSEKGESSIEYRKVNAKKHLFSRSGIYNIGSTLPKSVLGGDTVGEILDTSGEIRIDETAFSDGKITVTGRCLLNSIFVLSEGGMASADYTVPMSISLPCETKANSEALVNASLANARVRIEGNNIVCDMDVALSIRAFEEKEYDVVANAEFQKTCASVENAYPLCLIYPSGESLWSLAKKYRVAPATLASVNSLDIDEKDYGNAEAISDVKVLMLEFK